MKASISDFTSAERKVILEDQECSLKSFHVGYFKNCPDLARCPRDHFSEITWGEIDARQAIMRKLRAIQGRPSE